MLVLALFAVLSGLATWAAFSDTTSNSGNVFQAGSVAIADNDSGTAMYNSVSNGKPGDTDNGCIKVTYTGSLASTVKLYGSNNLSANPLADYLTLTITSGTGNATPTDCSGFTAAGSTGDVYNGTLSAFMAARNSYSNGLTLAAGGDNVWSANETVTYKFELTLQDDNTANGKSSAYSTGSHAFTWEAHNN